MKNFKAITSGIALTLMGLFLLGSYHVQAIDLKMVQRACKTPLRICSNVVKYTVPVGSLYYYWATQNQINQLRAQVAELDRKLVTVNDNVIVFHDENYEQHKITHEALGQKSAIHTALTAIKPLMAWPSNTAQQAFQWIKTTISSVPENTYLLCV